MDGQTDGHGETSIPPYNFVAGGIITLVCIQIPPMEYEKHYVKKKLTDTVKSV
jgi:hypothetical protein